MSELSRRELLRGLLPRAAEALSGVVEARLGWSEPLPEPGEPRVAVLLADRCIAHAGIDCGACARWCPEGGDTDALEMVGRRPRIDSDRCVGCGRCVEGCPVMPPAIELVLAPG